MNSKKDWSKILLVLGVVIAIAGVSYALWLVTFSSTNNNTITATCFNVSFTDQNNISIEKAYPLLDEEGKKLTPYEFTITNNCDTYVKYDINLEILNNSTLTNMDYIKLMLDDETPALVSSYDATTKTLNNASTAYKIKTSYLDAKESKTYNLRLWLDENVTGETEGIQNNTFASKITVNASYTEDIPKPTAVECVTTLAKSDTTNLATDDYGNIRYIGSNPNNYISIDGDIWRIIGVMKDIDDGTGNKSYRLKIIRADFFYNILLAFDKSDLSVNYGNGINEWSQADLMKLLNPGYENESVGGSLYWNNKVGDCYNSNDEPSSCDFKDTDNKLPQLLKELIEDAVWNTGSNGTIDYSLDDDGITKKFYVYERSSNTGKICSGGDYCNDDLERKTTWTGKIGLMYPSDYGYATSGGTENSRNECLSIGLNLWKDSQDCYTNNWLYDSSGIQFTLTPAATTDSASEVFIIYPEGSIEYTDANDTSDHVKPAAYLKPTVKIVSGTGSQEDPFVLSL